MFRITYDCLTSIYQVFVICYRWIVVVYQMTFIYVTKKTKKCHEFKGFNGKFHPVRCGMNELFLARRSLEMSFNVDELADAVNNLKCCDCTKILSVFPIHISSKNGYLCGRCFPITKEKSLRRATAYEAVAKFIIFPCCNNAIGCNAQLKHGDIIGHESICSFQKRGCPYEDDSRDINLKCNWTGGLKDLPVHLKVSHPTRYRENPLQFLMDLTQSCSLVYYFCFELNTFVINIHYDKASNLLYCYIRSFGIELKSNSYNYQLEISNTKNYSIVFQKPITENWTENPVNMSELDDKVITVDVGSVFNLVGSTASSLGYKISILKVTDIEGSISNNIKETSICEITSPTLDSLKLNQQLLEEMECPICSEYMFPPIFICSTGHSICCNCKPKIKECPTCRATNMNIRNFALEKMVSQFQYPCKYASYGCDKMFIHTDIRNHEINCIYQTKCILKSLLNVSCDLKGDIINNVDHIREYHYELIMNENFEYEIITELNRPVFNRAIISDEEIFIFCFKRFKTTIKFNILHFGLNFKVVKYRYKMVFTDNTHNGLTLAISQLCQAVPTYMCDAFRKCLVIPLDMLEPFMNTRGPSTLSFKFIIEKI